MKQNSVNNLKELLAHGELEKVLSFLLNNFSESEYEGEIIILNSSLSNLKEKEIKGIISAEELTIEKNKISNSILSLLDNFYCNENKSFIVSDIPEIYLEWFQGKYLVSNQIEELGTIFLEVELRYKNQIKPIFEINLINKDQNLLIPVLENQLLENKRIAHNLKELSSNKLDLTKRKEVLDINLNSQTIKELLNSFRKLQKESVEKFSLIKKYMVDYNLTNSEKATLFRETLHVTWNQGLVRSSANLINGFTGLKEEYFYKIHKIKDVNFSFSISLTEEENIRLIQSMDREYPIKYTDLIHREVASIPKDILVRKVLPRLVDEIYLYEKNQKENAPIKDELFHFNRYTLVISAG